MEQTLLIILIAIAVIILILLIFLLLKKPKVQNLAGGNIEDLIIIKNKLNELSNNVATASVDKLKVELSQIENKLSKTLSEDINEFKDKFNKTQAESIEMLNKKIQEHLDIVTAKVNNKLEQEQYKTSETFSKFTEKMANLENATKSMNDLRANVDELSGILNNDKARGKYGEVVLSSILDQVFGNTKDCYSLQYEFKYGGESFKPDAVVFLKDDLFLCIDSKFPFSEYTTLLDADIKSDDFKSNRASFIKHLKKSIDDISKKYIIDGITYIQAIMFIPNDGIFTFIHVNFYEEIIRYAMDKNVILTSPSIFQPLMYTLRSFRQNYETAKQINVIVNNINGLAKVFEEFKDTYNKYNRQIQTALTTSEDVEKKFKKVSSKISNLSNSVVEEPTSLESLDNQD